MSASPVREVKSVSQGSSEVLSGRSLVRACVCCSMVVMVPVGVLDVVRRVLLWGEQRYMCVRAFFGPQAVHLECEGEVGPRFGICLLPGYGYAKAPLHHRLLVLAGRAPWTWNHGQARVHVCRPNSLRQQTALGSASLARRHSHQMPMCSWQWTTPSAQHTAETTTSSTRRMTAMSSTENAGAQMLLSDAFFMVSERNGS